MSQGTVGQLVKQLRAMHGHLSAKDRRVVVECIGALTDLSVQLWNATHVETHQVPVLRTTPIEPRRLGGSYELRKVEEEADAHH